MLVVRQRAADFLRKEAVLCAAVLLAAVSACFVRPSRAYFDYIDWDTLALLFSLMAVVQGLQQAGVFLYLGNRLLRRTKNTRWLLAVLVGLPFVCSMAVTNDVSLLTFVPFSVAVLKAAGCGRLILPAVVLQTIAANLGSMLTPMGNPQNLYLYARAGLGFGGLCALMAPFVLLSAAGLGAFCFARRAEPVRPVEMPARLGGKKTIAAYLLGFAVCLLGLFDVMPPVVVALLFAAVLLVLDRGVLKRVDYSLLGTFVAFFIFVGNLGALPVFRDFLSGLLEAHAGLTAVLASQVISNVPAALLLSGFTDQTAALLVGCNLGGLGTLIASMASLISYRAVAADCPQKRGAYLLRFTAYNVMFLAALLALGLLLSKTTDFWAGTL